MSPTPRWPAAMLRVLGVLALLAATAGAALARSAAAPDTGVVREIHISDDGVRITKSGGSSTSESRRSRSGSGRTRGSEDADPDIEINVPNMRIHGPKVVVDGEPAGLVRVFADVHVPKGEKVDGDVVAVFGSATIEGPVTGSVVAVFGSVRLLPGASVEGDAVAVGGGLDQAPGTTVKGEGVSIGLLPISVGPPTLLVMLVTILTGWLLTMFMAWLLGLLFQERMMRIGSTASRQSGASILIGLLSAPLVVLAILLLLVTVIGIPFALLLPIAYTLTVWTGQLAATYLLGCKLLQRRAGVASLLGPVAAGSAFVALFFIAGAVLSGPQGFVRTLALFFALIGVLLVTGLSILGTGALLASRFGSPAREPGGAPEGLPAPPAPPAPPLAPPVEA